MVGVVSSDLRRGSNIHSEAAALQPQGQGLRFSLVVNTPQTRSLIFRSSVQYSRSSQLVAIDHDEDQVSFLAAW